MRAHFGLHGRGFDAPYLLHTCTIPAPYQFDPSTIDLQFFLTLCLETYRKPYDAPGANKPPELLYALGQLQIDQELVVLRSRDAPIQTPS